MLLLTAGFYEGKWEQLYEINSDSQNGASVMGHN